MLPKYPNLLEGTQDLGQTGQGSAPRAALCLLGHWGSESNPVLTDAR